MTALRITGSRRIDTVEGWEVRRVSYSDGTTGYTASKFDHQRWDSRFGIIDIVDGVASPRLRQGDNKDLREGVITMEDVKDDLAELEEISKKITELIKDRESFLSEGKWIETTLSVEEVAVYVGVGEETVRRWCRSGNLGHYKVGNLIRIKSSDLHEYLENSYKGASAWRFQNR